METSELPLQDALAPHSLPVSTGSCLFPSLTVSLSAITGCGRKEAHWGQAGGEGEAAGASEWPGCADGHRELAGPGAQGPLRWAAVWALRTSVPALPGPLTGTLAELNSYLGRKPQNFSSVRMTRGNTVGYGLAEFS